MSNVIKGNTYAPVLSEAFLHAAELRGWHRLLLRRRLLRAK